MSSKYFPGVISHFALAATIKPIKSKIIIKMVALAGVEPAWLLIAEGF